MEKITWNIALDTLKKGNKRFEENVKKQIDFHQEKLKLVHGQNPFAVVVGCADSRVAPEIIFDTYLGEIFVCRVAGNVINTHVVASIEYAVTQLGTPLIVVLGHEKCGAVTAATKDQDYGKNLNDLVGEIRVALKEDKKEEDLHEKIVKNTFYQADRILDKSHVISELCKKNKTKIVAAHYHFTTGQVEFLRTK